MSKWNKISLYKFQQIDAINKRNVDDLEKILLHVCIVFEMGVHELTNTDPVKVSKLCKQVGEIFSAPLEPAPYDRIGKYFLNYDISKIRFGQFIELDFFLKDFIGNAHKTLASISNEQEQVNDSETHGERADYFLTQPIIKITGSLKKVVEQFSAFKKNYPSLFGLNNSVENDSVHEDKFNKTYGWWYSAEAVANYKRITLDETYSLNVRDAFSALGYLKAKQKYESDLIKRK